MILKKTPMVVAECPKIFGFQCIWEKIFVSLENIFVFKYSYTIFHLVLEKVTRTFWAHLFGRSYGSNGAKIHLDAALVTSNF